MRISSVDCGVCSITIRRKQTDGGRSLTCSMGFGFATGPSFQLFPLGLNSKVVGSEDEVLVKLAEV